MPTVSIEGESTEYYIDSSTCLHEALKQQGRVLPSGCLAGSCGACRIEIVKGAENLSPISAIEKDTIDSLKANYTRLKGASYLVGKTIRLSCRAKLNEGEIALKLLD